MNILKKSIAPITETVWTEIKERTKQILDLNLTARKLIDVDGPNGLNREEFQQDGLYYQATIPIRE